jgi:hypothetical protein
MLIISMALVSRVRRLRANPVPVSALTAAVSASTSEEFTPTARGCGLGYAQVYTMRYGRTMGEGNACGVSARATRKEWRQLLTVATTIVERVPGYRNASGERGERVVAWFPPDEFGPESGRILWYDGGECYRFIRAPSLDIAFRFEQTNPDIY